MRYRTIIQQLSGVIAVLVLVAGCVTKPGTPVVNAPLMTPSGTVQGSATRAVASVTPSAMATSAAIPTTGAGADLLATIMAAAPAPSPTLAPGLLEKHIDVGGYPLYINCRGVGSPTVVLAHGSEGSWTDWQQVQPQIATFTRVCSYSRAPAGQGPQPRTSQTMVDELRALLQKAGLASPYGLVGHSWGGLVVQLYAHQHSDEVAGLVLVDSRDVTPATKQRFFAFLNEAASRGEKWARDYVQALERLKDPHLTWEGVDLEASEAQMQAVTSLDDLPLGVVTAGRIEHGPDWPPEFVALVEQLHQEDQKNLLRLSTNSFQVIAEKGGHVVQNDQPEVVIEAVHRVIAMGGQR